MTSIHPKTAKCHFCGKRIAVTDTDKLISHKPGFAAGPIDCKGSGKLYVGVLDTLALRYAGGMGHLYVSVRTKDDGTVATSGEYPDLKSARRLMGAADRLYKRSPDRTWWRRVCLRRSA